MYTNRMHAPDRKTVGDTWLYDETKKWLKLPHFQNNQTTVERRERRENKSIQQDFSVEIL